MANKIKGLTIEIGGETTALNKALGEVNKHSRDLQSELRNVERLLKLDPKSTELLKQKQEILAESISNTKSKLETLKDAEKQAQEQFKQGKIAEDQYRAIQREVIKTEQDLKKLDESLKNTNFNWKEIEKSLDKAGTKMEDIGKGMTKKITVPVLGAAAASFKFGADMEDALGKTDAVFKKNSIEIEQWSEGAYKNFGLAKTTALDMANSFGALASGMGLNTVKTFEYSKALTELSVDMVAFHGGRLDVAETALNSIFTGETESLKKYGIVMAQASLQQFANSKGIRKKIADMTEAEKVQLRYNFVMDKSRDVIGHYQKEQDNATTKLLKFKEGIKVLAESFSEQIMPIFLPFIEGLNKLIEKFSGLSDGARRFIVSIGGIIASIGPVLLVLGSVFKAISNISEGMKVAKGAIEGVSKAGSAISNLLSATGSWGFKEWAIAVAGIVALFITLIALMDAVFNEGRGMNKMVEGITNAIKGVGGAANSGNNIANKYISGSHRNGLDYVPRDNYIAQLHEGERVLTKSENQRYSQGGGDTYNLNVKMDEVDEVYKLVNVFENFKQTKRAGLVRG